MSADSRPVDCGCPDPRVHVNPLTGDGYCNHCHGYVSSVRFGQSGEDT